MLLAGTLLALSFANNSIAGASPRGRPAADGDAGTGGRAGYAGPALARYAARPCVRYRGHSGRHPDRILLRRPARQRRAHGARHAQLALEQSGIHIPDRRKLGVASWACSPPTSFWCSPPRAGSKASRVGKLTLGADASVAAGPVGRQGTAATDVSLAEIYSYARTRGLFGGIAIDGSGDRHRQVCEQAFYGKPGVTATEIFSGSGTGPAGDRATLPRPSGEDYAYRGPRLAGTASGHAGLRRPGRAGGRARCGACGARGRDSHLSARGSESKLASGV